MLNKTEFFMKKIIVSVLALVSGITMIQAQTKDNVGNADWTVGVSLNAIDRYTSVLEEYVSFREPMEFGPKIWFWKNFGSSIALEMHVQTQLFTGQKRLTSLPEIPKHYLGFGGGLVYKFNNGYILKENAVIAPFIFGYAQGVMMSKANKEGSSKKEVGAGAPVGLGFNIRIGHDLALQLQGGYTFGLTDNMGDNIFYSVGIATEFGGVPEPPKPPVIIPVAVDTDGDGIPDDEDECPTIAGLAELNGCPDTDGDGIADHLDDCPMVAGLAEFNGCPDSDGDGIPDHLDECPYVAGLARLNGCPEPDSDGDGVIDSEDDCPTVAGLKELRGCPDTDGDGIPDHKDKCPTVAGPASNQGCPEIKDEVKKRLAWAASNILFESGKSILKASSLKVLDEVASILQDYPDYNVSVEGHTDSQGDDAMNQKLSEDRAKAAADYLVSKGVAAARVTSKGFGESTPIADNATAAGRQQNRRVEFTLTLK
jgi:OmpA-OmpF porin, OOP family